MVIYCNYFLSFLKSQSQTTHVLSLYCVNKGYKYAKRKQNACRESNDTSESVKDETIVYERPDS